MVDGEVSGSSRQCSRVLRPGASALRVVSAKLCEVGLCIASRRGKDLEGFVTVTVALQVVSPEADGLLVTREARRDQPVVSTDEVLTSSICLVNSNESFLTGVRIEALSG